MQKASCGGLWKKKNAAYHGAWLGLGMDCTCSTQELAPEIPSCPCIWHSWKDVLHPWLGIFLPGFCAPCGRIMFGQPGLGASRSAGTRGTGVTGIPPGLLELCLSHKQGRRKRKGKGGVSGRAEKDLGGSARCPEPHTPQEQPGQAIVTSQSSREGTELCLKAFWGIANTRINQAAG